MSLFKKYVSPILTVGVLMTLSAVPTNAQTAQLTSPLVPKFISTSPANGKTCVGLTENISVLFNEAMDPRTIGRGSLTLSGPGGSQVIGQVSYVDLFDLTRDLAFGSKGPDVLRLQQFLFDAGFLKVAGNGNYGAQTKVAVSAWQTKVGIRATGAFTAASRAKAGMALFEPIGPLASNTTYITSITTEARDMTGHPVPKPIGWSFKTLGPDCKDFAPTPVTRVGAPTFGIGLQLDLTATAGLLCTSVRSAITSTFARSLDSKTLTRDNVYVLDSNGQRVAGDLLYLDLHDLKKGLTLGAAGVDVVKLQVFLTDLGLLDMPVPTGRFGVDTQQALKVWQRNSGIPDTGTFDNATLFNAHVAVFQPSVLLAPNSGYLFVVTTGTKDVFGVPLLNPYIRNFVTGPDCQTGAIGARGLQGAQGFAGSLGLVGPTGLTGPAGPQGATGAQGIQGERGPGGGAGAVGATGAGGSGDGSHVDGSALASYERRPIGDTPTLVATFPPLFVDTPENRVMFFSIISIERTSSYSTNYFQLFRDVGPSGCNGTPLGVMSWPMEPGQSESGSIRSAFIDSPQRSGRVSYSVCAYTDRVQDADVVVEAVGTATEIGPPPAL